MTYVNKLIKSKILRSKIPPQKKAANNEPANWINIEMLASITKVSPPPTEISVYIVGFVYIYINSVYI